MTPVPQGMSRRSNRRLRPVLVVLVVLVVLGFLLELAVGAAAIDLPRAVACLVAPDPACDPGDRYILLVLRLPRALGAVVVGAGLAIAGAAMQGLFRNPLADPGLVGVSSGAALGAALAIALDRVLPALPGEFAQPAL
ncbi:iron chelate uptake ABC transporter family permease subunit, partial [Nannocystis sp. SCPEA4]|uniref:iron chelate uptake ABC transporter family permease subunit n=1 Tax=Nannocystis sp. SCPEA4 TaxID=2996787 RepID=UPI0023EE5859